MASLRVITPGMLTTIQDRGRWGWQAQGVAVAGPMDPYSYRLANALAHNESDEAALEVTLVGPEIEFDDERIAAVAGADFDLTLDGLSTPMNAPFAVHAGSVLRFRTRRRGARAYLAIGGGIAVPPVLESRATHLPTAMGGLDGRPLRAGDRLPLGKRGRESFYDFRKKTPVPFFALLPDGHASVRVLPGPQMDRFASDALDALQSAAYVVDAASNRMGFRLQGPTLRHAGKGEMLSDATPLGAIQVPAAGQPILLMADRQTTGGYPIIATVISADIGLAGQLAPGDSISFVVCSLRDAMAALIAQEQTLMSFEAGKAGKAGRQ
ncbi:MAG TPA: biotin-dependent carboxyltransferase family protein [Vicinamibacterales bacterium]|jgi:antagonist of KipI